MLEEHNFQYEILNAREYLIPFSALLKKYPQLNSLLISTNPPKFDLGDPATLSALNYFLFKELLGLEIVLPPGHLIPTLGIRHAYADIINSQTSKDSKIIEIGTGASAAISMILAKKYGRTIVATEINEISFQYAKANIVRNNLREQIQLLLSKGEIIEELIPPGNYGALLCYPPIYPEKDRNLVNKKRGWRGVETELIAGKDPLDFSKKLLEEAFVSTEVKIALISLMVLKEEHVKKLIDFSNKYTNDYKIVKIIAGTRNRWVMLFKNLGFQN